MSFDFALERQCEHEVLNEIVELDSFVKDTIRFPRPTSSVGTVRVIFNGQNVPSSGLYSAPSFTFTRSEPYRIKNGVNDILPIKIGNESVRNIQTISGSNISAIELAKDLSRKIPDLVFAGKNGKVTISSRTRGRFSGFSVPDPRWVDRTSSLPVTNNSLGFMREVGINPGRVATGVLICPGWEVIEDSDSFIDGELVISFVSPVISQNPVMQISYFTAAANCRRCLGTRYEFDYGLLGGTYETVDGADLLLQEFDKFVFTKPGSHWKWSWLGSSLVDRIGSKAQTAFGSTRSLIASDIGQAFRIYQNIKSQQDNTRFQSVTDPEYPVSLENLSVEFDEDDPTVAVVQASIVTRSRDPVELKRVVKSPSEFNLATGGADNIKLRG